MPSEDEGRFFNGVAVAAAVTVVVSTVVTAVVTAAVAAAVAVVVAAAGRKDAIPNEPSYNRRPLQVG